MGSLRDFVANSVSTVRPELFYYRASADTRRGIKVIAAGDQINIFRPEKAQLIRIGRKNAVYLVNIIEQFDDFHGAVNPVQVLFANSIYSMVDFSSPRLHDVTGFDDFPVMCPSLTEAFTTNQECINFASLTPGQVAIDLGSYNGLTSIAFSKGVGATGRVVALEPDPLNFSSAAANFAVHRRVNGLDNIVLMPAAAAADDGVLQLSSEGATGSALRSIVGGYRGRTVEVEAVTLQTIADRHNLECIDFIKIDIEGAERELVPHSHSFFQKYRPRLMVEPHRVNGTSTSDAVRQSLSSIGYSFMTMEHRGLSMPFIAATLPEHR